MASTRIRPIRPEFIVVKPFLKWFPAKTINTSSALGEVLCQVNLLGVSYVLTDGAGVVQVRAGVLPVVPAQTTWAVQISVLSALGGSKQSRVTPIILSVIIITCSLEGGIFHRDSCRIHPCCQPSYGRNSSAACLWYSSGCQSWQRTQPCKYQEILVYFFFLYWRDPHYSSCL